MTDVDKFFEDNRVTLVSYNGGFWADEEGKLSGISRFNFLGRLWFWVKDKWSKGAESQKVQQAMEQVLTDSQTKINSGEQIFLYRTKLTVESPGSQRLELRSEAYYTLAQRISKFSPTLEEAANNVGELVKSKLAELAKDKQKKPINNGEVTPTLISIFIAKVSGPIPNSHYVTLKFKEVRSRLGGIEALCQSRAVQPGEEPLMDKIIRISFQELAIEEAVNDFAKEANKTE